MSTLPPPPPTDPDELASAIVDGLLPAEAAAAARRDPAVARRVQEIESTRAALRVPAAAPNAEAAERTMAAALAAFDASAVPPVATGTPQLRPVPPSGPAGWVPARRRNRPAAWLAAAAAIAVVGLLAAGLVRTQDDNDDQMSSADAAQEESGGEGSPQAGSTDDEAPETQASDDGAAGSDASPEAPAAGESDTSARVATPHLGSVEDADELAAGVADALDGDYSDLDEAAQDVPLDATTCPGLSPVGDPARGAVVFVADATFQGSPVAVHLYERDGTRRLVATDQACTDVVDTPFTG